MGGKTITPEPYVPDLTTLREKIEKDAVLLGSLDPASDTYRRLQDRIDEQTTQLLNYEETLEQRRQQAAVTAARQARADEQSTAVGCGLFAGVGGVLAIVIGWGSWWVAAGVVLVFVAIGAFATAKDM